MDQMTVTFILVYAQTPCAYFSKTRGLSSELVLSACLAALLYQHVCNLSHKLFFGGGGGGGEDLNSV